MPVGVMSSPPGTRALTLPEVPWLTPSSFILRAVARSTCRSWKNFILAPPARFGPSGGGRPLQVGPQSDRLRRPLGPCAQRRVGRLGPCAERRVGRLGPCAQRRVGRIDLEVAPPHSAPG